MHIERADMGTFMRFHDAFFHLIDYMIQGVRRKQKQLKYKHYTNRPEKASTNTKHTGARPSSWVRPATTWWVWCDDVWWFQKEA
jgi:hypothetical protein